MATGFCYDTLHMDGGNDGCTRSIHFLHLKYAPKEWLKWVKRVCLFLFILTWTKSRCFIHAITLLAN